MGFIAVCGAVLSGGRGDWNYFVELGRAMLSSDGLSVYARHADAQTGPLTLITAAFFSILPRNGFVLCVTACAALGILSVWLTERFAPEWRNAYSRRLATLFGGAIVIGWWSSLGAYGHIDDASVLVLSLVALACHTRNRALWAAVAVGIAIAFKPWAVIFGPLCLPPGTPTKWPSKRRILAGPAIAAALSALLWLPFILAEPSTIRGLSPTVNVAYDSIIRLVGLSDFGDSRQLRVVQLLFASTVVLCAVIRERADGALVAGIAARLLLDPGTWTYYSAGFVLGALVWDLWRTERTIPLWTIAASVAVVPDTLLPFERLRACLRLIGCVVAIVGVCVASNRRAPHQPLAGEHSSRSSPSAHSAAEDRSSNV
jgi:hypothetical protein